MQGTHDMHARNFVHAHCKCLCKLLRDHREVFGCANAVLGVVHMQLCKLCINHAHAFMQVMHKSMCKICKLCTCSYASYAQVMHTIYEHWFLVHFTRVYIVFLADVIIHLRGGWWNVVVTEYGETS